MSTKKFNIKFEGSSDNSGLEKRVLTAKIVSEMNSPGQGAVELSLCQKVAKEKGFDADHIPSKISITLNERLAFTGYFLKMEWSSNLRTRLLFADPLALAKKNFISGWIKKSTLRDTLLEWVSELDLRSEFLGDFSDAMSGASFESTSYFDLIAGLARKHGFSFFFSPAKEAIVFLRIGSKTSDIKLKETKECEIESITQSLEHHMTDIKVSYLKSSDLERSESSLSGQRIYDPAQFLADPSRLSKKKRHIFFAGSTSVEERDSGSFGSASRRLGQEYSSRAQYSEQMNLVLYNESVEIGQALEVAGSGGRLDSGNYLVSRIETRIASNLPRSSVSGVRI